MQKIIQQMQYFRLKSDRIIQATGLLLLMQSVTTLNRYSENIILFVNLNCNSNQDIIFSPMFV